MPEPDPDRIRPFATPEEFWCWLSDNHDSEKELWVKIFKKASGKQTIVWDEAVIEALCWGWIDGIKKSLDDEAWLQRFTPRRKGSIWSRRNREHVERLIAEGRMQEPGLVHVRAARLDGRWENAYQVSSGMEMPEDFIDALANNPIAQQFYEKLNKSNRYAIAYQLTTAKKPETRERRFKKFIQMLERGEKLH